MKTAIAVFISLVIATSSNAATVLFFSPTSATSTTLGGSAITVDLVLQETNTTNISQFGVEGASFKITRSGAGTIAAPIANASFDSGIVGGSDPTVSLNQTSILGVGQGSSSVVIGSFLINPTSTGSGSLSVSAFGNFDDIAVYTNNVGGISILSPGIFNGVANFNYSISAVPEPSSALLVAIAGVGIYLRRRRKSSVAK